MGSNKSAMWLFFLRVNTTGGRKAVCNEYNEIKTANNWHRKWQLADTSNQAKQSIL